MSQSVMLDGAHVSLFDLASGCSLLLSSRRKPGSTRQATSQLRNGSRLSPGRQFRVGYGALAVALLLLPAAALAAALQPAPLSAQDNLELQRIAAYLNGIRTMTARFSQVTGN